MIEQPNRIPLRRFLAPRYWLTWLGLGILRLLFFVPFRIQARLVIRLMRLTKPLLKRRSNIARRNLELCFPEQTAAQREQLLNAHLDSIALSLVETIRTWWGSTPQVLRLGEVEGAEHLRQAQSNGQGVLLLTGHFTTLELGSHLLGRSCVRFSHIYRPIKNPLLDQIALRLRSAWANNLFTRDELRPILRELRSGGAILYAFDQNFGQRGVFVPFFGVPAKTITATSRLAEMGRAAVVPVFPIRLPDGSYRMRISPALDNFPSGDDQADAQRLNQILEQAILQAPEQYLWIHRRFKTRPPGEPSVYL